MFSQYKDVFTHLGKYSKNIFRKGYFSWLFKQMSKWSRFSWGLIIVNFIIQVLLAYQGWATTSLAQTILGFIGANLSVMCVIGISQKSAVQGWLGLTSGIAITASGIMAHNYADATLQIGYILFLDLFCILSPNWNNNVHAHKMSGIGEWVKYIIFYFFAWAVAYLLYKELKDPRLLLDSATLAISVTGSLMEFNLLREQFYIWTLSSVITLLLWVQTAMSGDANYALVASYLVFFLNDCWAFCSKDGWFRGKSAKEAKEHAQEK